MNDTLDEGDCPVTCDLDAQVYRIDAAAYTASPSTQIVTAVATITGRDPVEMPPIADVVDPDALDALFGTESGVTSGATLSLTYLDWEVVVRGSGDIEIRPGEGSEPRH